MNSVRENLNMQCKKEIYSEMYYFVQFNFHDCMSANFLKCSSEMDGEIYALKKVLIATS